MWVSLDRTVSHVVSGRVIVVGVDCGLDDESDLLEALLLEVVLDVLHRVLLPESLELSRCHPHQSIALFSEEGNEHVP